MEESMLVEFPLLQLPKDLLQEFLMACDPEDALTMEQVFSQYITRSYLLLICLYFRLVKLSISCQMQNAFG